MEEQAVKKRGWVKNAAIIFLSILLVLTFFSQTILNRSLPEVSTASVTSDSINAKIRGNGTVTAGDTYEVVLEETRTIQAVYAKVGDMVAVGDVLFLLADTDSTELSNAQDRLAEAKRAYQSALIDMGGTDYARENRQIQKYREALAEAQAAAAAGAVTIEEVNQAASNLKEAQRVQKELNKQLTETKTTLSEATTALETLESSEGSYAKKLDAKAEEVSDLEDALWDLEHNPLTRPDGFDKKIFTEDGLARKKIEYSNYWNANRDVLDSLRKKAEALLNGTVIDDTPVTEEDDDADTETGSEDNEETGTNDKGSDSSVGGTVTTPSASKGATYDEKVLRQMKALSAAYEDTSLGENYRATADEHDAFEKLWEKYKLIQAIETWLDAGGSTQKLIDAKTKEIEAAEEELDELNAELRAVQKELAYQQGTVSTLQWNYDLLESNKEQQDEAVTAFQETYDDLKDKYDSYELLQDAVEDAQDTLENALFDLAQQKEDDGKQAAKDQLSLQAQKDEIAKLEAEVAEWQAKSVGAEVTARSAGIISSVNAVAGREATPGSALATIEMVDRGYTLAFSVTKEQAQRVRLGDKAEITNYWWGSGIEATLTQIIPDENNPAANKKLVFTLTGDVSSGDNLTLSIGEKSANYDSVIPSSALRTDSNGTFVLVMTAKSTPLGNRYTATRVDVRVLAQDDTKTAVSGLSYGDFVITTSSKPLDAGMQVRMVDNAT